MDNPLDKLKGLTLDNLGSGAAEELFQHELKKVLHNLADPNTDPKASRKILIEVVFVPVGDTREVVNQVVKVTSKLAGLRHVAATTYLVERNGEIKAVSRDIRQVDAFEEPVDPSVRPLNAMAQKGTG